MSPDIDYTTLSLADVRDGLEQNARDLANRFSPLTPQQFNWRPDAAQWSVAQCVAHLVTTNHHVMSSGQRALDPATPRTVWQRLPWLPGMFGRMLVRSQAPSATRKFKTSPAASPAASDIGLDIVQRFVDQQAEIVAWLRTVDEGAAARARMVSPFASFITYSVLDGVRLLVAHDRRHMQQAGRVIANPGFPTS